MKKPGNVVHKPGSVLHLSSKKPTISHTSLSKFAHSLALLYSFNNGVLTTVELPGLRVETHKQRFKDHRCGFNSGKFYFLPISTSLCYTYDTEALGDAGTLKVYNPYTKVIEKTVDTCTCNCSNAPLLLKGSEIIDIGWYSRTISAANGARKIISTIGDCTKVDGLAVCLVLNKTIYLAASCSNESLQDYEQPSMSSTSDLSLSCGLFSVSCSSFKATKIQQKLDQHLEEMSLIPISPTELLLFGWAPQDNSTVAYRLIVPENRLQREGGSKTKLGVCQSFCVLDGVLYMLFASNWMAKCRLATGMMHAFQVRRYLRLQTVLFGIAKSSYRRLPASLVAEVLALVENSSE